MPRLKERNDSTVLGSVVAKAESRRDATFPVRDSARAVSPTFRENRLVLDSWADNFVGVRAIARIARVFHVSACPATRRRAVVFFLLRTRRVGLRICVPPAAFHISRGVRCLVVRAATHSSLSLLSSGGIYFVRVPCSCLGGGASG